MLKADIDNDSAYSGEGSNTDSGRGPSEEGDKSIHTSSEFTNMCDVCERMLFNWLIPIQETTRILYRKL